MTGNSYDFGTAMHKEGEYYYKVRAVGGEGVKEGRFTVSENVTVGGSDAEQEEKSKKKLNNSIFTPGEWNQSEKG